jgi:hypothetical protein
MPPRIAVCKLNQDGSLTVLQDNGKNPDGSDALASWEVSPQQLERHMPMFQDSLSPGDRSAALDRIRDAKR